MVQLRFALVTLVLLLMPSIAAAANRIVDGDFETPGSDPTQMPGWTTDSGTALRAPLIGVDNTSAALLVGPAVLRSALFLVTPGETLDLAVDVWEMRDDADGRPGFRGDSTVSLEFVTASGGSVRQLEFHCDAYVDLLDNNVLDESDTCTLSDGYVNILSANPAITCVATAECAKYSTPIVVPTGAVRARILLGGSTALDGLGDSTPGLASPTSLTAFDNVNVTS